MQIEHLSFKHNIRLKGEFFSFSWWFLSSKIEVVFIGIKDV